MSCWTDKLRESRRSILKQYTQLKHIEIVRQGLKFEALFNMDYSKYVITDCIMFSDDGESQDFNEGDPITLNNTLK